jgi:hypothetical protein
MRPVPTAPPTVAALYPKILGSGGVAQSALVVELHEVLAHAAISMAIVAVVSPILKFRPSTEIDAPPA